MMLVGGVALFRHDDRRSDWLLRLQWSCARAHARTPRRAGPRASARRRHLRIGCSPVCTTPRTATDLDKLFRAGLSAPQKTVAEFGSESIASGTRMPSAAMDETASSAVGQLRSQQRLLVATWTMARYGASLGGAWVICNSRRLSSDDFARRFERPCAEAERDGPQPAGAPDPLSKFRFFGCLLLRALRAGLVDELGGAY